VPDFTGSLLARDYSRLWEEHVVNFTRVTFPLALERLGLSVREVAVYPYALEDSLVAVAQWRGGRSESTFDGESVARQLALGRQYAADLSGVRERWRQVLSHERQAGGQVALLGAGHLGIMFLNLLGLRDLIDLVLDDDSEKIGCCLPGSRLCVEDFSAVYGRPVQLCLLSVSPESETLVRHRHREFLERGGRLVSIFPDRPADLEYWIR
jgi:hypothetical protein